MRVPAENQSVEEAARQLIESHQGDPGIVRIYLFPSESEVRLAPIYDLVTTTAYKPLDILALTLGGSKRWPAANALIAFARTHCNITDARTKVLLEEVAQGVRSAAQEARLYMHTHAAFQELGAVMLAEWAKGLNLSIQTQGSTDALEILHSKV